MLKSQKTTTQTSTTTTQPIADDDLLAREWADMEIRRDPPRTTQPSHVGKRMSECTEAYLLDYASFFDWKARKGREEDPPRLNNKGKPWYESDELTAKIARGWAARAAKRKKPVARTPQLASTPQSTGPAPIYGDEEEVPF